MSPRPRATFSKRQKEQARQEKQRAKAQRKLQRKLESQVGVQHTDTEEVAPTEEAAPESPCTTQTEPLPVKHNRSA